MLDNESPSWEPYSVVMGAWLHVSFFKHVSCFNDAHFCLGLALGLANRTLSFVCHGWGMGTEEGTCFH